MPRRFALTARTAALVGGVLATLVLPACAPRRPLDPHATSQPAGQPALAERFRKHEYRIPMRDGVKLYTVVYSPRAQSRPLPILFKRTPYGCRPYGGGKFPDYIGPHPQFDAEDYIIAYQDVRGRFLSEGVFDNMRPHQVEKRSPRDIDESTDTYDTIAWFIANVPGNNGRVGMWGISYPGFYAAAGAIDSHPALKAASPQAPVGDWWFDDFHHHGAFFLAHAFNFMAVFDQPRPAPTPERAKNFEYPTPDGYAFFLELGPVGPGSRRLLGNDLQFWNGVLAHPNYDEFWQRRNIIPHLHNIRCAVLTVGGWFDAEDLYGPLATYRKIEQANPGIFNTLVMGPWSHGGWARSNGDRLGNIAFGARTAEFFRDEVEAEFFRAVLHDDRRPNLPEALVFETGENRWRRFDDWPPRNVKPRRLFLDDAGRLVSDPPAADGEPFDQFISDPSHPAPYTEEITTDMTQAYMTDDQRFATRRADVLVYQSPPLSSEITMAGPLAARFWVSTSRTDADWIVKLIDVFPEDEKETGDLARTRPLAGYQMLVRSEVFRGRFRESYARPRPFRPNEPTLVEIPLQDVLHTFERGHRIMIQIQSTWFPLVDRNPQNYVPNIYEAQAADFAPATHRVFHTQSQPSQIEFGWLPG